MRLRREAQREQRATGEAAVEGDDRRAARVRARELDRVLDRLGARVEEGRPQVASNRDELDQPLGKGDVVLVRDDREVRMREALDSSFAASTTRGFEWPTLRQPTPPVSRRGVPVDIGDRGAVRLLDHDRQIRKRLRDDAGLSRIFRLRVGDIGLEVDCSCRGHGWELIHCSEAHGSVRPHHSPAARRGAASASIRTPEDHSSSPRAWTCASTGFFASSATRATRTSTSRRRGAHRAGRIADDERRSSSTPASSCLAPRSSASALPDESSAARRKSSLGRLGLLIHSTAGFIDPGFDGHVTLELSNVATLPITLYAGMKIGQLCFLRLTSPPRTRTATPLGSKYQGQAGADAEPLLEEFRVTVLVVGGTRIRRRPASSAPFRAEDVPVRLLARRPERQERFKAWGCELVQGDMTDVGQPAAGSRRRRHRRPPRWPCRPFAKPDSHPPRDGAGHPRPRRRRPRMRVCSASS